MTTPRTREALRQRYLLPALAQLRHAYWNLTHKDVRAMSVEQQREFAVGLIAPQIRRLEELEAALHKELQMDSKETACCDQCGTMLPCQIHPDAEPLAQWRYLASLPVRPEQQDVMRCSRCGTDCQDELCIDGSSDTHTPVADAAPQEEPDKKLFCDCGKCSYFCHHGCLMPARAPQEGKTL